MQCSPSQARAAGSGEAAGQGDPGPLHPGGRGLRRTSLWGESSHSGCSVDAPSMRWCKAGSDQGDEASVTKLPHFRFLDHFKNTKTMRQMIKLFP